MRNLALPLLAVFACALAACNSSGSQSAADDQALDNKPLPTAVDGTVSLQAGSSIKVSPEARLELTLVDISKQPSVPIASKTIDPVRSMPVRFSLPFSRDRLIDTDIYIVRALITDGERLFTTPLEHPVLTQGAGATVDIVVAPEATDEEEQLAEFRKAKNAIGGLDISQGTSLGESSSRAWQIFSSADGAVQYVIEIVDYFDAGRTTTDYAYKNGKPWVVVQQHMASADAPADSVDRAGWNEAGELVVQQHDSNGETSELSTSEAQSLREQAESMLKRAQE